jgi:hypothetical protein
MLIRTLKANRLTTRMTETPALIITTRTIMMKGSTAKAMQRITHKPHNRCLICPCFMLHPTTSTRFVARTVTRLFCASHHPHA